MNQDITVEQDRNFTMSKNVMMAQRYIKLNKMYYIVLAALETKAYVCNMRHMMAPNPSEHHKLELKYKDIMPMIESYQLEVVDKEEGESIERIYLTHLANKPRDR